MSNIQNIDISLQEIVKNISKDSYLIPKFQRDFVWNNKDIIDLGDSLIRGYPISSLLIMAENGTLKVGSHSLSKEDPPKDYEPKVEDNEIRFYILDGQQRLTSISKLFLNFDNKNEYYFDLLSILSGKFPDDDIANDSGVKENCLMSKVDDIFCRSFRISSDKSEKPTRQNNRFISGKNIIDNKFGSVVSKFLRVFKDASEDDIDKYTDHLNAVLGSVGGYSIPATVIASDSELGIVIRVFEKVNSTGKKLTLFDLINAKSFQVTGESYRVGLSEYLTNDIISILSTDHRYKNSVDNFLKYDEDKRGFDKLDKIIRVFEVASLLKKQSVPSILQSVMLAKEPEFWFETWNDNRLFILKVISWMGEEGLTDIGQVTFLEYALAIFLANRKSFESNRFKREIKKYALYLAVSGTSFSKSNLDTVEKLSSISRQITDNHESTKYDFSSPSRSPNLTAEQVLEITTSNSKFKAVMNIFYVEKINAKFTVDIVGTPIKNMDFSRMDNHHIFPKSRVAGFTSKSKFNSIANFVVVDSATNRENIRDKTPKEYFRTIASADEKASFNCEQNLININDVMNVGTESEAELFIDKRAKAVAEAINSYFN